MVKFLRTKKCRKEPGRIGFLMLCTSAKPADLQTRPWNQTWTFTKGLCPRRHQSTEQIVVPGGGWGAGIFAILNCGYSGQSFTATDLPAFGLASPSAKASRSASCLVHALSTESLNSFQLCDSAPKRPRALQFVDPSPQDSALPSGENNSCQQTKPRRQQHVAKGNPNHACCNLARRLSDPSLVNGF